MRRPFSRVLLPLCAAMMPMFAGLSLACLSGCGDSSKPVMNEANKANIEAEIQASEAERAKKPPGSP